MFLRNCGIIYVKGSVQCQRRKERENFRLRRLWEARHGQYSPDERRERPAPPEGMNLAETQCLHRSPRSFTWEQEKWYSRCPSLRACHALERPVGDSSPRAALRASRGPTNLEDRKVKGYEEDHPHHVYIEQFCLGTSKQTFFPSRRVMPGSLGSVFLQVPPFAAQICAHVSYRLSPRISCRPDRPVSELEHGRQTTNRRYRQPFAALGRKNMLWEDEIPHRLVIDDLALRSVAHRVLRPSEHSGMTKQRAQCGPSNSNC